MSWMRSSFGYVFPAFLAIASFAQQPAAVPKAITDPKLLVSTNVADLTTYALDKFMMTRSIGESSWSPDGKSVVVETNISGRDNLWIVPADGGWPRQLTISDQRQTKPAWSPDGQWIAFQSDKDGNEQWDIFVASPRNGDVVNLTNSPEVSEESPSWQPRGRLLAITVKASGAAQEVATLDVLTRRVRKLTNTTSKDVVNSRPVWSPDGKQIAYTQASGADSNVFVVDIETGKSTNLTPHTGEHRYSAAAWSPDGKNLLVTSNEGASDRVGLLHVASKQIRWLSNGKTTAKAGCFSPDGKRAAWTLGRDSTETIVIYDLLTKQTQVLPAREGVDSLAGSATAFSKSGNDLLYRYSGPTAPDDLWVYDLSTRRSRQITNSLVAGLRPEDMVSPTLVQLPNTGAHALVYVPHNIIKNAQYPALIYLADTQFQNSFRALLQYMVNQGYIVVIPDRPEDAATAADFIKQNGYVNPKKIILMGRGYGGYLTLASIVKSPDEWAAAVAVAPDMKSRAGSDDPISVTKIVNTPLLAIAGANDPNLSPGDLQQITNAVKRNGGSAQLKIYDEEGSPLEHIDNRLDAAKRISDFIKVQVPSPGCGCELIQ
ncbi:MAG TPA: prolyl oligopeptidase family serine peptidase [Terriglobales bacterium]|nr:prolyl oligopeptidase family serine peptidase [Terriglobales bacterium]